jgi:N-acetylmuramoyl-L-alanine amidase
VLKKIIAFIVAAYLPVIAVLFIGCEGEESYRPEISGVVPSLRGDASYRASKPQQETYKIEDSSKYRKTTSGYSAWAPPSSYEKNWKAIIIHHSATDTGSVATIDDYHRKTNGWDGIGYDFVIGNGRGAGNGEVDSTFRWTGQKTGAHCKTDASNWANEKAIGICLVGNFDYSRPSSSQMTSLVKLVRFLSERYDIPQSRVYGHNTTPGHSTNTECPGKNFPMSYVKSKL